MKKVAATSGQRVSLATVFFVLGITWEGWAGRDKVLNSFLSSSLSGVFASIHAKTGRISKNTESAHACNKKMHDNEYFFTAETGRMGMRRIKILRCGQACGTLATAPVKFCPCYTA